MRGKSLRRQKPVCSEEPVCREEDLQSVRRQDLQSLCGQEPVRTEECV